MIKHAVRFFLFPSLWLAFCAVSQAGWFWVDYGSPANLRFGLRGISDGRVGPPVQLTGVIPGLGSVKEIFSTLKYGYDMTTGYKGAGPWYTFQPGVTQNPEFPWASYDFPWVKDDYTAVSAALQMDDTLTLRSDYSSLMGGALPAGSWLYYRFDRGGKLEARSGWYDEIVPQPSPPSTVAIPERSLTGFQLQGSGGVFVRTALPLSEVTFQMTGEYYVDGWGETRGYFVSHSTIIRVPDNLKIRSLKINPAPVPSAEIAWDSEAGATYAIQASPALSTGWEALATVVSQGESTISTVQIPEHLRGKTQLYFRVAWVPQH